MITLHHLEYSQSFRILWLLEELGVEYELKIYERNKETHQAPAEYKELSPLGSAPVITEGDLVLAESSAIVDYILDKYPDEKLRPTPQNPDRTRYLFWFHAAQGSMMPMMLMEAVFQILIARVPFWLRKIIRGVLGEASAKLIKPRMEKLIELAENDLEEQPWFGGEELSAADILLCYPMESAKSRGYIKPRHDNCNDWLDRVFHHPSYQAARKKDGRDSIILKV